MRWPAKQQKLPAAPLLGQLRERRLFALFPTRVGDFWVWLESFVVVEAYEYYFNSTQEVEERGWVECHRRVEE